MLAQRLRKDERGATAVEFALVIVPFLGLTFAVFEIGYAAFVSSALSNASGEAARMIRTGRVDAPKSADAFKTAICDRMAMPVDRCKGRMTVNVQTFGSFDAIGAWNPPADDSFVPGGARDIQLVRATYRQPLITPLYTLYPRSSGGSTIDLTSTFAFRNEPYE